MFTFEVNLNAIEPAELARSVKDNQFECGIYKKKKKKSIWFLCFIKALCIFNKTKQFLWNSEKVKVLKEIEIALKLNVMCRECSVVAALAA